MSNSGTEGSQSKAKPLLDGWRASEIPIIDKLSLGLLLALLSGSFGSAAICLCNITLPFPLRDG
jgi:hypothetical protein